MNDEKYDLGENGGMKFKKGRIASFFENFFYHYKWHTLIALFLIVTVTVCSVQMCNRTSYDVYIIYAGSKDIKSIKTETDVTDYAKVYKSLCEATADFDGNGENVPSLEALYMLSSEEIAEIEAELAEKKANGEDVGELGYALLASNNQTFRDRMMYSEFYVCLISESLYNSYKTTAGVTIFTPLLPYVEKGTEGLEFLDDSAIYLKSTGFATLPGICDLPEDTVVALRSMSAISSHFDKDGNETLYSRSETVVKNIINYGK